ncbi:integral membrane protein [Luminiphilus syltensis NOR5-1B]|uniref:Integral membrane protein n=2 Tax=Luminiphilus TaxID=1341118 RepID=B8KR12_9GAMM|nr:integral membrane protein [Luminiphilus syltensis NOR5-1B]
MLGLAGAGHCLGMCGGIAIALRPSSGASRALPIYYHLGRLVSYSALGGLLGGAAAAVDLAAWTLSLRFVAAVLLVAMGLSVLRIWSGISRLEQIGAIIWRWVAPATRPLIPPRYPLQSFLLGSVWGLMPCGLIYSALTWSAATAGSSINGALLMFLFGIGTLPAMLGATLAGQSIEAFFRHPRLRQFIGISLIFAGVWTAYIAASHAEHLLMPPKASGELSPLTLDAQSPPSNHHH